MAGISDQALVFGKWNRYRYNGIELDTSLSINDFEAPLRTLDPQIGKWWQVDPKSDDSQNDMSRWSPYISNKDNPILLKDPKGDCPACWGAAFGAALDYASQVYRNYSKGETGVKAWTDINGPELLTATLAGAASGGLSTFYSSAAAAGTTTLISQGAAQTLNVAAYSVTSQLVTDKGTVSIPQVAVDMVTDRMAGLVAESLLPRIGGVGEADHFGHFSAEMQSKSTNKDITKQSAIGMTLTSAASTEMAVKKTVGALPTTQTDSRFSNDASTNKISIPVFRGLYVRSSAKQ